MQAIQLQCVEFASIPSRTSFIAFHSFIIFCRNLACEILCMYVSTPLPVEQVCQVASRPVRGLRLQDGSSSSRSPFTMTCSKLAAAAALVASICLASTNHASAFSPTTFKNAPPSAMQSPLFRRNRVSTKDTPTLVSSTSSTIDNNDGRRRRSEHSTQLKALNIPSTAWSAIGHVVSGASGAFIVAPATKSGGWYEKINLPSWVPPNWLFAPVWTTLYACVGVAAARVHKLSNGGLSSLPMILWAVHYTLNLAWAPAFFGQQMLRLGQAINVALMSTLVPIIVMHHRLDRLSACLLLPHLAWISFATILNGATCKRNPTSSGMNEAKFQSRLIEVQKDAAAYADSW